MRMESRKLIDRHDCGPFYINRRDGMRKKVEHHDVNSLRGVEASKLLEPRLVCNRPLQVRRTTAMKGGLDYNCKTDHLASAESFTKSILMCYHILNQAYEQ